MTGEPVDLVMAQPPETIALSIWILAATVALATTGFCGLLVYMWRSHMTRLHEDQARNDARFESFGDKLDRLGDRMGEVAEKIAMRTDGVERRLSQLEGRCVERASFCKRV
jgi:hypothetical protein